MLLNRRAESQLHMIVPSLGDQANGPSLGLQGGLQAGIVRCRATDTLGHAEGGEGGVAQARIGAEELRVRDIGAWISPLNVIDTQLIERPGDQPLVLEREVNARRLRAIAQRRIEEIEPLAGHDVTRHVPIRSANAAATINTMILSAR